MKNQSVFFTIIACNYLGQALTLGRSLKKYHPDIDFYVFLMDDVHRQYGKELLEQGFKVIHPDDINIQKYKSLVFKYNIVEASTAVKPSVASYLFDADFQKVIYIDPDIFCYRRLDDLLSYLDEYSIVITPHILTPASDDYLMNDRSFLESGIYNLGFLALSKSESSIDFLKWWSDRLQNLCIAANEINLFVDQKWVDFVPTFFDNVLILKDPAYNIAYWNVRERELSYIEGKLYVTYKKQKTLVAFIHFSAFDIERPSNISKRRGASVNFNNSTTSPRAFSFEDRPDLVKVWNDYRDELFQSNYTAYLSVDYGFGCYDNGEVISDLERILYLSSPEVQSKFISPFVVEGDSFHQLCRKSGIRALQKSDLKVSTQNQQSKYQKVSVLIHPILRLIIFTVGIQRYTLLAKYLTKQMSLYNHSFLIR
jgi:hypothetical protein